jgi:hypothetical protein
VDIQSLDQADLRSSGSTGVASHSPLQVHGISNSQLFSPFYSASRRKEVRNENREIYGKGLIQLHHGHESPHITQRLSWF